MGHTPAYATRPPRRPEEHARVERSCRRLVALLRTQRTEGQR